MRRGSVAIENAEVKGQELDIEFKPGLFLQAKAFLDGSGEENLCRLSDQLKMLPVYSKIAGYS